MPTNIHFEAKKVCVKSVYGWYSVIIWFFFFDFWNSDVKKACKPGYYWHHVRVSVVLPDITCGWVLYCRTSRAGECCTAGHHVRVSVVLPDITCGWVLYCRTSHVDECTIQKVSNRSRIKTILKNNFTVYKFTGFCKKKIQWACT